MRWLLAIILSLAIGISYYDRQALPIAIKAIQDDIPTTDLQYSYLISLFLLAYGLACAAGGRLLDVLGTKTGFLVIMVFWSLACASHALATGFTALLISRILLGLGEGGGFSAATKAIAEWFPDRERSLAMGMVNAGTAIGAMVAPPAIYLIIHHFGWRYVFVTAGIAGLMWSLFWSLWYRSPSPTEAPIARPTGRDPVVPDHHHERTDTWWSIVRNPVVLGMATAKCLSDAAWFFLISWMPKYLYDIRAFDIKEVGYYSWIPFFFAGIGCLAGGYLSGRLIARGFPVMTARVITLGLSAALLPQIILIPHVPNSWCIVLFSIAFCGQQSWSTIVMTIPSDLCKTSNVGSVAGFIGLGGALGGVLFNLMVGLLLEHLGKQTGYQVAFIIAGLLHATGFVIIWMAWMWTLRRRS